MSPTSNSRRVAELGELDDALGLVADVDDDLVVADVDDLALDDLVGGEARRRCCRRRRRGCRGLRRRRRPPPAGSWRSVAGISLARILSRERMRGNDSLRREGGSGVSATDGTPVRGRPPARPETNPLPGGSPTGRTGGTRESTNSRTTARTWSGLRPVVSTVDGVGGRPEGGHRPVRGPCRSRGVDRLPDLRGSSAGSRCFASPRSGAAPAPRRTRRGRS